MIDSSISQKDHFYSGFESIYWQNKWQNQYSFFSIYRIGKYRQRALRVSGRVSEKITVLKLSISDFSFKAKDWHRAWLPIQTKQAKNNTSLIPSLLK
jgi:hypothetical protein